jgi:hypothetical protein
MTEFKRIAFRVCKIDQSFSSMTYLVAAIINSRWISTSPNFSGSNFTRDIMPDGKNIRSGVTIENGWKS